MVAIFYRVIICIYSPDVCSQWVRPFLAPVADWLGYLRHWSQRSAHLHQGNVSYGGVIWCCNNCSCFHIITEINQYRYKNIPSYVTENGLAWQEDTVEQAVNDTMRQQYLHDHIDAVGQALQAGCDVKGYFVWSFQVRIMFVNNCVCTNYCYFLPMHVLCGTVVFQEQKSVV